MVKYWGWGFQMFSKPLSKCSWRLSNAFFIAFYPPTLVSMHDTILFGCMIFIFGYHQEVFDGSTPFEVYLNAIFLTYIFVTLIEAFSIWNSYIVSFLLVVLLFVDFFLLLLFLFDVIGALIFFFILFKAHFGFLHLVRPFWRCSSAPCNCCKLEHTA